MKMFLTLYPGDGVAMGMANAMVQATAVLILAGVLAGIFRRAGAHVRYGIWLCALACVLASPFTAWVAGRTGFALVKIPFGKVASLPASPAVFPAPAAIPAVSVPAPDRIPPVVAPVPAAVPLSAADRLRVGFTGLMILWAAVAVFLFGRLVHGWGVAAALRRSLKPVGPDGAIGSVLADVRRSLGVQRLPSVATSGFVDSPISLGIRKPVVVLPTLLINALEPAALRDVLVHECAHVLQRDHLVGLLQRFAAMVFWPHPMVYVLNRELARAREEVCDNHVLKSGDARGYAQALLDLAEKTTIFHRMPATVGLVHPRWSLEERVEGLLDKRRALMTRMNTWALGMVAVLLLSVGTTACVFGARGKSASEEKAASAAESMPAWEKEIRAKLQEKISFQFDNQTFGNVVDFFRDVRKLPILVDPRAVAEVNQTITLSGMNMSIELALKWLMKLTNLDYVLKDGVIFIGDFKGGELARAAEDEAKAAAEQAKNRPADGWEWEKEIRAKLQKKITFQFDKQRFEDAVDFLRDVTKLPILVDPNAVAKVNPTITLSGTDMSVELALNRLMKVTNLDYVLKDGVVYIFDPAWNSTSTVEKKVAPLSDAYTPAAGENVVVMGRLIYFDGGLNAGKTEGGVFVATKLDPVPVLVINGVSVGGEIVNVRLNFPGKTAEDLRREYLPLKKKGVVMEATGRWTPAGKEAPRDARLEVVSCRVLDAVLEPEKKFIGNVKPAGAK
ncbi:MAG: M56 family metallopeptidase [Planctomycetota bacterium]